MTAAGAPLPAPRIPIAPGVEMPQLGYGLYKVPADDAERLVGLAIDAGYRHLDGAAFYGNEPGVGRGIRNALEAGLNRDELFVTSKVWNTEQGYDRTLRSFDRTLDELGLEQLDLFLIHWPCPARGLFVETYRALERLRSEGRVRAIGVSNFQIAHLRQLLDGAETVPAINQVELHPWLQQRELREFHTEHGITTEAWSPLARGRLLDDPVLTGLARDAGVSVARLVIRWHLQTGGVVIPKASSASRIAENGDVFDFELDASTMAAIAELDRGFRSGSHPDEVN
ncbi:oxidoreductase [Leucobacter sp. UCD-THU]|uniref:aldo/keto reductase n=1 Tax=Leucobacter sp. UCD-THU TaxID=1292023 RepID=UPI00036F5580|nr:aldo/keto reductase [Leucobacter sp. UCD-THU]EYT54544.1 oxidoreductase [Leucobacter sp. UCD-THU]